MDKTDPDIERAKLIDTHGWMVMLVGGDVPFGYTIGISKTFGHPELFIAGMSHQSIHNLQ